MNNMITSRIITIAIIAVISSLFSCSQYRNFIPDLSETSDTTVWHLHNRTANVEDGVVHLDGKPFDGILWHKNFEFINGKIELDIKGKNDPGKSFVGIAFHGLNDSTFDAVYFRPFNFQNQERSGHSVQYISHPTYTWRKLRAEHPEKYENPVIPVPDPDDWFHATIVVDYPSVKVFVNDSEKPSLVVNQMSDRQKGWIGFWVGHGSEGYFRNLVIIPGN